MMTVYNEDILVGTYLIATLAVLWRLDCPIRVLSILNACWLEKRGERSNPHGLGLCIPNGESQGRYTVFLYPDGKGIVV